MVALIIGGSGSGKSEFAEELACSLGDGERIYIATMQAYDEESRARVMRHRAMRADRDFQTLECPLRLEEASVPEGSAALIECISNLVANELFDEGGRGADTVEAVVDGVKHICAQAAHTVIVTNDVFSDGSMYDAGTEDYIKKLGAVNRLLGEMADEVYEVVFAVPDRLK